MPRFGIRLVLFMIGLAVIGTGVSAQTAKKKDDKKNAKPAKPPQATTANTLKVAKGFAVELLYSVPQDLYGSWVNICPDGKGRLIVSDQYGKLYRLTPPPLGQTEPPKIETIPAEIGSAQGLLWAFDALYVVVNAGKPQSGLYKVTSSKNDDKLDTVQLLKAFQGGGGEHGPHAVLKHPDGKHLTVVCGNQTKLVDYTSTKVPPFWGEDHLLPRMPDGRGFMKGVMGPGGAIYNVTPDGKEWELFCVGFRNEYDAAYNKDGDLFTYDADMEWDFNTPWYRPTRVCQVISGGEYGWRNGAGKYPEYYPDNLPPVVNIGPGSPTGVTFGYGAKFPKKYQDAFFICDWSYGKLYALHMNKSGSGYKADVEEFVSGTPLPLTDLTINPADGAMYFLIGGRKTQSGLYRVTATPEAFTSKVEAPEAKVVPKSDRPLTPLEFCTEFHGKPADAKSLDSLMGILGGDDRIARFSARAALEFQPVAKWKDAILSSTNTNQTIHGLLALARVSAPCPLHSKPASPKPDAALGAAILAKLNSVDMTKLSEEQQVDLVRVYQVLFNRFGPPTADGRQATLAKLHAAFPTGNRFLKGEIAEVVVFLESPTAASTLVKAILDAPSQEEQIEYARSLRVLKTGWTPELRKSYFEWMQKADGYRGGNSFGGFLSQIRNDAIANLNVHERGALQPLLEVKAKTGPAVIKSNRPVVKQYKLEDIEPLLEKGLAGGRDHENGRKMFAESSCGSCHRYNNEGGISGPDLTQAAGRFSPRDLLISILDPNKEISDQYAAVEIETEDGKKIIGRIVNHNAAGMTINTNMLDPLATVSVKQDNVASIKLSKVSMMPAGLIDILKEDEILDLMAYVLARGDKNHKMFKK
ncbi:c-type cytochrome [soil metagenome]